MTATIAFWPAGTCIQRHEQIFKKLFNLTVLPNLVKLDEFNGFGGNERLHGVHEVILDRVKAQVLVVRNHANGLFAHRALVRVAR